VHNEFRRLTKDEPRFDLELSAFLARGYNLKAIADYDTGPATAVTVEQAERAIATAQRFIVVIEELLT
jgi:uncharacterized protein (UPF0332 family)